MELENADMKTWKRILALAVVVIIVGMVIATFIMGITGSKYTLGMFGLTFLVVIQVFILLLFMKYLERKDSESDADSDGNFHSDAGKKNEDS